MNPRALLLFAAVSCGLVAVTQVEASGASLGILIPLIPIATLTGHGFGSLTGVALLKLKAAAALAGYLFVRKGGGSVSYSGSKGWGWEEPKKENNGWEAPQEQGWQQESQGGWEQPQQQGGGWEQPQQESHGGGWDRRRRAIEVVDEKGQEQTIDMKEYDPSYDQVLAYDQFGCGLRLVCELSSTPEALLADDEKLILELFGRDSAPNAGKASKGKLSYSYAAILGANAKDSSVCGHVYGMCPYGGQEVMQTLRKANV